MKDGKKAGAWIMTWAVALTFALGWDFGLESVGKQAEHEGHDIYGMVREAYVKEHPEHDEAFRRNERTPTGEMDWALLNAANERVAKFARERFPAEMERRDELYRKSNLCEAWSERLKYLAVGLVAVGLLALLVFGAKVAAGRAQTQGQRVGLVLVCASPAALAFYRATHSYWDYITDSTEFLAFLFLAGAGVLLFLKLPQKLLAWIAGGTRD